jgi:hypothetical protein
MNLGPRFNLELYPEVSDNQLLSLANGGGAPSYVINDLGDGLVTLSLVYNNMTQTADVYVNGIDVISGFSSGEVGCCLLYFGGSAGDFTNVELLTGSYPDGAPVEAPEPASAARWKFQLRPDDQAASGLPVLVHLNGFAMVRLK